MITYAPLASLVILVIVTLLKGTPSDAAIDGASTSVAKAPVAERSVPVGTVRFPMLTVPTTGDPSGVLVDVDVDVDVSSERCGSLTAVEVDVLLDVGSLGVDVDVLLDVGSL